VRRKTVAIDRTEASVAQRLARLRRARRVSILIGSLLSVLLVLGLQRCL
jgi:hypothetical protein